MEKYNGKNTEFLLINRDILCLVSFSCLIKGRIFYNFENTIICQKT
jgi:hypothetical protein